MITWTPNLETGHAMVDHDHKQLVATLNELDAALKSGRGKDELAKIIGFLVKYTTAHFAREEEHMRKVACPSLVENCAAHRLLKGKLTEWGTRMQRDGATTALVLEVYRETSAWIQSHIVKVDCQLRGCRAA